MLLVVLGSSSVNLSLAYHTQLLQLGLLLCGLQPIVSTCMVMTKADVRKHTLKVVTLSYIRTLLSSSLSYVRTSLPSRVSSVYTSLSSRLKDKKKQTKNEN